MGKIMRFLYSFMLIVVVLLGALFLAFGIDGQAVFEAFVYNEYLYRLVSNEAFVQIFFMSVGILLIGFAIVLLIVLKQNSNMGFDVLIEDEKGSILLTRRSLEAVIEKSVNKFFDVKMLKAKAVIIENERIEAKALVDYYGGEDLKALAEKMREEISKNLKDFTGLDDIRLDLKLDKKEIEVRRNGRY